MRESAAAAAPDRLIFGGSVRLQWFVGSRRLGRFFGGESNRPRKVRPRRLFGRVLSADGFGKSGKVEIGTDFVGGLAGERREGSSKKGEPSRRRPIRRSGYEVGTPGVGGKPSPRAGVEIRCGS